MAKKMASDIDRENGEPTQPDQANWASRCLDHDCTDMDRSTVAALPETSRRQLADYFLLDALLHETFSSHDSPNDERLNRVMLQLDESSFPQKTGISTTVMSVGKRWLISSLSITAGIAALVSLWFVTEANAPTAHAAVQRAMAEARRPIDRHYQISFDLPAIKSVEADLYVRGDHHLALNARGPLDLSVWLGVNGEKAWFVPRLGPAVVTDDVDHVQERLEELSSMPLPLLNITRVLDSLEKDYELTLSAEELPQQIDGQVLEHVQAIKRSGFRPLLPDRIEFWSQPSDGVIVRLKLEWAELVDKLAVRRVEFLLVDQKTQAKDFYEHTGHHAPELPVLHLDGHKANQGLNTEDRNSP